jgi:NAD(P)-dependent dehydrogenase (short-subunit alcohol dehydrogenase family)
MASTTDTSFLTTGNAQYTMADQPARFAAGQAANNARMLDIDQVYDPAFLKGKRVAVTGANRGIGLSLAQELTAQGALLVALVRQSSPELDALNPAEVVTGCDVTSDSACATMASTVSSPIDILINNAGYFYEPVEKITDNSLNFGEELKMIDICALGPLRVTNALYHAKLLGEGCRIAMITSQGGSIAWRPVQNADEGGDYGHHMSKAAANMMSALVAQEFKKFNIPVGLLHPGFNKTDMTKKYAHIWEIEGAVDASVGAKRVLHEVGLISMATTGKFINCEDGLEIPF